MTNSRTELLSALDELSRRYPNWRLGQMLANLADWADQDIWNAEDDQLLAAAKTHLHQVATPSSEVRA